MRRPTSGTEAVDRRIDLNADLGESFGAALEATTSARPSPSTSPAARAVTGEAMGNRLIGENDTMNAQTLPKVKMPNRDGFIIRFPDKL